MQQQIVVLVYALALIIFLIIIHEGIHLIFAKLFCKKNIRVRCSMKSIFLEYDNDNHYFSILMIAIMPALLMFLAGLLLFKLRNNLYLFMLSICLLIQPVSLLPFCQDGKTVLFCMIRLISKKIRTKWSK